MNKIKINRIIFYSLIVLLLLLFSFFILSKSTAISFIKKHGAEESQISKNYNNEKVKEYCGESYQLYASGDSDVEHIFAQSWIKDKDITNDYFNMRMANKEINNKRGDKGFSSVKHNADTVIKIDGVVYGWMDENYFEPLDQYKGDIARTLLYMYYNYDLNEEDIEDYFNIKEMKEWAKLDKLSKSEKIIAKSIQKDKNYMNLFLKRQNLINYF